MLVMMSGCRPHKLRWPYQNTQYLSALPGVAGPGMNFGTDLPSKLYFITSTADTNVGAADATKGPNCFSGTARYCWAANQGVGFHKYVIPLVSGYCYLGRSIITPAGVGNMDYIGHAAPGVGLVVRCATPLMTGGSNMRVWHMPSWVGDEPSASGVLNYTVDHRDGLQCAQDGYFPSNCAWINCEARFFMDEGVQVWYAMNGISWIRGAVYDPLHTPPDFWDDSVVNHGQLNDHGFGHIIGGSDFVDNSLVMQSVYAHTTDRNPLCSANNHAHVNILHYNHGHVVPGKGEGLKIQDNGGHNAAAGLAMKCNLVGNVSVRGPNNNAQLNMARIISGLPVGSSAHSALNSQFGWTNPASQDDFFTFKTAGYMQPTLRSTAWYDGLGPNYNGVLPPAKNPLAPTVREGLAYVDLMRRTVGCKPGRRHLYSGGVDNLFNQIERALLGHADPLQYVNTVAEAGGWPTLPTASVNPASPGSEYHAPMPMDSTRDDILLSGRFADGSHKAGYTKIRAWTIDQYHYSMARQ
jgi:hypothetical protein